LELVGWIDQKFVVGGRGGCEEEVRKGKGRVDIYIYGENCLSGTQCFGSLCVKNCYFDVKAR